MPDKDYEDYKLIRRVFNQSMKTYGYRRITDELKEKHGVIYNAKKVLRIMNKYGYSLFTSRTNKEMVTKLEWSE